MTPMPDARPKPPTLAQRCRRACAPLGERFRLARERYPWLEPVRKTLVTMLGVLLILGGLAIGWLPGPGGFIAFFGIAILAGEYRWVRRITRQTETRGHRLYVRVTGSKPRWWYRVKRKMASSLA